MATQGINLSEEEINLIKQIQYDTQMLVKEFGQISILEINTSKRKEIATNSLSQLRTLELNLSKSLEEKYGKGTVDLDSGKFLPIN